MYWHSSLPCVQRTLTISVRQPCMEQMPYLNTSLSPSEESCISQSNMSSGLEKAVRDCQALKIKDSQHLSCARHESLGSTKSRTWAMRPRSVYFYMVPQLSVRPISHRAFSAHTFVVTGELRYAPILYCFVGGSCPAAT